MSAGVGDGDGAGLEARDEKEDIRRSRDVLLYERRQYGN